MQRMQKLKPHRSPALPHMISPLQCVNSGMGKKRGQTSSKQKACYQSEQIIALIFCKHLNGSINNHGEHQSHTRRHRYQIKPARQTDQENTCQLTSTARTERELLPFPKKGAVTSAMASKNNRKPAAELLCHAVTCQPDRYRRPKPLPEHSRQRR